MKITQNMLLHASNNKLLPVKMVHFLVVNMESIRDYPCSV